MLSDWCSHEFNEMKHISNIHLKYGENHLQEEIAKENTENGNSKKSSAIKTQSQSSEHLSTTAFQTINMALERITSYWNHDLYRITTQTYSVQGPPPKFS